MSKGTVYDWTKPWTKKGETVTVRFNNPPMESASDYLRRVRQTPRDEFFRLLNLNMEQRTGDEPV